MISSNIEFDQAVAQLERMYRALAGLESRLSSADESQFQVLAESPIDEIRRLQADIDTYLGVTTASGTTAPSAE